MKKLITFVFLFFIAIQFGFSQTHFGIKAGANIANMNFNNELQNVTNAENKDRIGYQVGIVAQREISSKVYLRSELFYSLKGYRLNDDQRTTAGFNYINLPVLIGYKLSSDFSVFLGPQLGLLGPVYAKDENNGRSENLRNVIGYNKVDFGIGAGVNYTLASRISIDLRYNYGFNNILVFNFIDSSGNEVVSYLIKNNKTLEISFNYFFRPKQ